MNSVAGSRRVSPVGKHRTEHLSVCRTSLVPHSRRNGNRNVALRGLRCLSSTPRSATHRYLREAYRETVRGVRSGVASYLQSLRRVDASSRRDGARGSARRGRGFFDRRQTRRRVRAATWPLPVAVSSKVALLLERKARTDVCGSGFSAAAITRREDRPREENGRSSGRTARRGWNSRSSGNQET